MAASGAGVPHRRVWEERGAAHGRRRSHQKEQFWTVKVFQTWCDFFILVAHDGRIHLPDALPEGVRWLTVESVESVELRHTVR